MIQKHPLKKDKWDDDKKTILKTYIKNQILKKLARKRTLFYF